MSLRQLCLGLLCLAGGASSHSHHSHNISPLENISAAPIDAILWMHILIQTITWMVIFPTGIVLGFIRSRWHVPVQVGGIGLAVTAYILGHMHGGREFRSNAHGDLAKLLTIWLTTQTVCGVYLKLHLKHKYVSQIRPTVVAIHSIFGTGMPIAAWVQAVLGGFTTIGFCHGNNASQCAARTISGSFMMFAGICSLPAFLRDEVPGRLTEWARRLPLAQTVLIIAADNVVLIVDWISQDTVRRSFLDLGAIYLIWASSAILILTFGRSLSANLRANAISSILMVISGWFISLEELHPSASALHGALGFCIQGAGFSQLVLAALETQNLGTNKLIRRFASLSNTYFLIASGFLFMGTTREQLEMLKTTTSGPAFALSLQLAAFALLGLISTYATIWMQRDTPIPADCEDSTVQGSFQDESQTKMFEANKIQLPPTEFFVLEDI